MSNEDTHLQTVRVVKPQIQHATSLLSSSAGYLSDYASDASSARSATNGYSTPPSRVSTPVQLPQQQEQLQSPMTLPPQSATAMPSPLNIRGSVPGQAVTRTMSNTNRSDTITPGVDDTPYIRFAVEQLTFDEELMGRGRHSSDFNTPYISARPTQPEQTRDTTQPQRRTSQPPQRPFQFPRPSSEDTRQSRPGETMLLAADPPSDRHQLGFVPTPLRPASLGLLIFLCIWIVIGLIAGNIYALTNHGLYDYDGNATAIYFVFEYLPPLLGIVLIFWLFAIQAAVYRILPYTSMSKPHASDKRAVNLQRMPIIPANFVLPDWRFFERGEPQIGLVFTVLWLMNWTIPLLSCLYGTQWFTNVGTPRFRWTPVQGLGWFIMVLYLILIAALAYLMIRFRKKNSNLMWDPSCLADLIILFQRSNVLQDYMRSETKEDLPDELPARYSRLGYWTTNQSPDVFYAVGEANQPIVPLSPASSRQVVEKTVLRTSGDSEADRLVSQLRDSHASSFSKTIHSPFVRFRWCAWFLQDSAVLAWSIAAFLLIIGFLVVSFVNQAVQDGWNPLLSSTTQSNGFSPANFLYSFIPALLGMFLFLAWQPIDTYYRALQPYANLSQPDGATARRSILQSYNAMLLGVVTIAALRNRDLKLAYITLISFLSATIPVLAGAVFTANLFPGNQVRMLASMPGYYALCVFLAIYAASYLMIWPTRKRYLPHPINTVAGNLSFLYASRLMRDSSIRNIRTKADFIDRLEADSNFSLTGYGQTRRDRSEKPFRGPLRYGFGVFTGVDGQEHLGIDRMMRSGNVDALITTGAFHNHNERM